MSKIIKFRIFLWLILAVVTFSLLYFGIVPGGKISYSYDFIKPSEFIKKLTPIERVLEIENGTQKIIGDPVYFSLRTPRRFNKAKLIIKYRYNENEGLGGSLMPIIETGVLVDKIIWRYDLKPVENSIIDKLALAWEMIEEDGIKLLQREKKYNSLADFLNNLPAQEEIGLYNYNLLIDYIINDYTAKDCNIEQASECGLTAIPPLRGAYQFYTYIKDEELNYKFKFNDLNLNDDPDLIEVNLYYDNSLIDSQGLDDTPSAPTEREMEFKVANLPEGVYKIEVKVNDDIITKEINTSQSKIAFINKLWLADAGEENISLYTDGSQINAETINPSKLQTIKFTGGELIIEETYKLFSAELASTTTDIVLEKDDLIISGNGIFSFSKDSLINPSLKKIGPKTDFSNSAINYIIANYQTPRKEDEWQIAEAEFDLTSAYREFYKYSFIISIPGLKTDDEINDWLEISEIKVELRGKSLWEKIRERFSHNP
ncbi:MAG: hypothetical protein ABIG60_01495 [Patescibacteria group bacterium]